MANVSPRESPTRFDVMNSPEFVSRGGGISARLSLDQSYVDDFL